MLPSVVQRYWDSQLSGDKLLADSATLRLALSHTLPENRRLILLSGIDGRCRVVLDQALASALGDDLASCRSEADLRARLQALGLQLHGADQLFYWPEAAREALRLSAASAAQSGIRQLSEADSDAFADFQAEASDEDLDAAFVELDHRAVFGAFDDQGRLRCAASAYSWDDAPLADLGVLSLPAARGRGLARSVLRALAAHAWEQGLVPQYRCQLDNAASLALARAAGLQAYGQWDVLEAE
ncbi:GNAT family N-acetyltransferase [Paucibacter sp. APW11]|uniref:GNAT family N-acetyltransferase n=1 Tax=Roseateles aquae TaxID=3077235 RepID=A0ABU3PEA1_9BURK|nr:GNAT family N-acetyltransferase [Paucibacter sp. APW11]MDT9000889.1 GNAT family N-acetyltransferase [Paucibacter sp. APW11]